MFCLRSWLPLLFIPTNASPLFILSFVTLTYILHRPCIYCSALLLILFVSSCHWSDRCFFDFRGDWFAPRFTSSPFTYPVPILNSSSSTISGSAISADDGNLTMTVAQFLFDTVNSTTTALANAAIEEAQRRILPGNNNTNNTINGVNGTIVTGFRQEEWTGIGLEWLRSLLGRREWTLPCINVKVRL